jgi:hypothetical protein
MHTKLLNRENFYVMDKVVSMLTYVNVTSDIVLTMFAEGQQHDHKV